MDLLSEFIFAVGSLICHQRPERSFFVGGHQLPVCARCAGLYLSGAFGLVAWIAVKTVRRWQSLTIDPRLAARVFLIAALPTVISVATGFAGVWDGSNVTRALLAIPLGVSAGAIVAAVASKDLR